jgi:hypothetical protein
MLPDGVLVVRLCGPLTGEALLYFKTEIVARHGPNIRAFVADYRAAIIALDGAELDAVLEGEPDGSAPSMAAAMVVKPESITLFAGHAIRVAMFGVVRQVFAEIAPATLWARRYAVAGV